MVVDTIRTNGGTTDSSALSSFANAVSSSDTEGASNLDPMDFSNGDIRVVPRDTGLLVVKQKRIDPSTNKVIYQRKFVDPVMRPATTRNTSPQSQLLTNEVSKIMAGIASRKSDGSEEPEDPVSAGLAVAGSSATSNDCGERGGVSEFVNADPSIANAPIDTSVFDKAEAITYNRTYQDVEPARRVPPLTHVDLMYQLREDPMDTST